MTVTEIRRRLVHYEAPINEGLCEDLAAFLDIRNVMITREGRIKAGNNWRAMVEITASDYARVAEHFL